MTTKTKEKPGAAEALETVEVPIRSIRVDEQHRRHFDEKKIKELAGSVEKVGVLQPLLLRSDADPSLYRLVAGERRLRAAKLAGLETVPARVGIWNDQEAAEIQAFENLHRQDLTPIEEARAFDTLLKAGGYDVKALAERVDKSEGYVYRAIKLLEIPKSIQDAIEKGELTPTHGRILLRATPKAREGIAKWLLAALKRDEVPTARETWSQVEQQVGRDLTKAAFPKDVPFAGQVACAGCPFNSGNQADLFDDAEKGRCTNPGCFDAKTDQGLKEMKAKAEERFSSIQSLGTVQGEDDLTGYHGKIKNGQILEAGLLNTPKMKEQMAKNPDNFAWAFIQPKYDYQGRPRAVVVALSAAVKGGATGGGMTPADKRARQAQIKKNFIDRHVAGVLAAAGIATVHKFSKAHMAAIVARMPYMNKDTRIGLEKVVVIPKDLHDVDALIKLDEGVLRALAFGQAMWGYGAPEEDVLELVGVNVKKVKAEATKAATAAYEDKKAGKTKEGHDADEDADEDKE